MNLTVNGFQTKSVPLMKPLLPKPPNPTLKPRPPADTRQHTHTTRYHTHHHNAAKFHSNHQINEEIWGNQSKIP
jgi:hypothetical protein